MFPQQKLTPEQALQKLRHYCGYQERSHLEVKEKLYSFGLHKNEVEQALTRLIEEDYLNEQRFAILFAGGKFRMKHWGKIKIKHELKQKQVSDYCINKALKEIDDDDYWDCLKKLCHEKWQTTRGQKVMNRKAKTYAFLAQRGFESSLIQQALKELEQE